MTDRERGANERMYCSSIYSHKKDKDPHGTGLARFDSSIHDICVYIHRLQTFFDENPSQIDSDESKVSILFERIGEADKERLRYGFTEGDFQSWDITTSKIIQKYPPRDSLRYTRDLKTNTQDVMNLPAHDYFGFFKNMYTTYQMYTRATGTALDQKDLNETEFVKQFLQNCRPREHIFLLQKVNDKHISDVATLEDVIRDNVSTFQTYYQVHAQEKAAMLHHTSAYLPTSAQQDMDRFMQQHSTSTYHQINVHQESRRLPSEHNTTPQRGEEATEKVEMKETESHTRLQELEEKMEKVTQSVQQISTRQEQSLSATERLSEQLLTITETLRQQDRDRSFERNRNRSYEDNKGFESRGRSRERTFYGSRDRDRSLLTTEESKVPIGTEKETEASPTTEESEVLTNIEMRKTKTPKRSEIRICYLCKGKKDHMDPTCPNF